MLRAGVFGVALMLSAAAFAQLPAGTQDASSSGTAATSNEESARLNQVNEALEKGDLAGAVALLTKLTGEEAHQGDPHLWFDLGYAQEGLGHAAEAEAGYRKAAELDAKYFEADLALGLLLAREDKLTEAHAELATAIALPTENKALLARAYRALAHIDIGTNAADARDELLAALKLTPETPDDALLAAETAERLDDPAAAEAAYRRVLKVDPKNVEAIAGLAHSLVKEHATTDAAKADDGKIQEAEGLLTEALAAHPGDAALTAQLATIYAGDSEPARQAQAVPLVEELHQKNPNDASVTRLLARLYGTAGEPEKAEPLYRALVAGQGASDPVLLDALGSTLIHEKKFSEAEEVLKRAVLKPEAFGSPDDLADAYSDLAFAASENGNPQEVLLILGLRAKIAANTAGSLFLTATSYDKLHQVKQASAAYQEFLTAANGKFPDQEWQARHRLVALEHMK
jgi:tetratricopeptide (TPR) repeat protein